MIACVHFFYCPASHITPSLSGDNPLLLLPLDTNSRAMGDTLSGVSSGPRQSVNHNSRFHKYFWPTINHANACYGVLHTSDRNDSQLSKRHNGETVVHQIANGVAITVTLKSSHDVGVGGSLLSPSFSSTSSQVYNTANLATWER